MNKYGRMVAIHGRYGSDSESQMAKYIAQLEKIIVELDCRIRANGGHGAAPLMPPSESPQLSEVLADVVDRAAFLNKHRNGTAVMRPDNGKTRTPH